MRTTASLVLLSLCSIASSAEIDVTIYRTAAGQKYIADNKATVSKHEVSLRPEYTPAPGEDTPVFKFYSHWTAASKLHPNGEKKAVDDIAGLKIYRVTQTQNGNIVSVTWYCLSNTSLGMATYVDQWSFIAQTEWLMFAGEDPYFNKWYGDVLEAGWGVFTIEEFDFDVEIIN